MALDLQCYLLVGAKMTSQLSNLKTQIESYHWTWRSESNGPQDMAQFSRDQAYTFKIYAGSYVRKVDAGSELLAAQGAFDEINKVLKEKGGSK